MVLTARNGFLTCLLLVFFFFLAYWVLLVCAAGPNVAGIENNTIYFVQRLLSGQSLYTDPAAPPYAIAQYGPLYYWLVTGIARITGIGPDDLRALFIISRLFSICLLLFTAYFTWLIGRKVAGWNRLTCSVLFAFVFIYFEISSFARADSLANLFYFAGFYALLRSGSKDRQVRWLMISALLAVLAFYAKQSSGSLALITTLYLLIEKQHRALMLYLSVFVVLFGSGLAIIGMENGLRAFYGNIIEGVNNGIDTRIFVNYIIGEFFARPGMLWLVLMAAAIALLRKWKTNTARLLILAMTVQLLVSVLLSLKKGSSSNYFTEWWILVILSTAWCRGDWRKLLDSLDKRLVFGLMILLLLFRASGIVYAFKDQLHRSHQLAGQQRYAEEKQVAKYLEEHTGKQGYVFNNIFSPDSYLNNLLFRQAVMPQNDIVVFGTWGRGVFNYQPFNEQLKDGSIRYIVTRPSERAIFRLPIDMAGYKLADSIGAYYLYRFERKH